jgi:RNA polymerase sigma-70 factor (ECF subfamily)
MQPTRISSGLRARAAATRGSPVREQDFERLYSEHAEPLLAFLVYRTGDRTLSEDLLADTFERVLTTRRRFDRRKASEKTWLYTIALNLLRDRARRAAVGQRALERVAVGEYAAAHDRELHAIEDRDALQQALAALSTEEREAIALRFGADLTVPEIAALTKEKLTTVEGRVYRALRKLKQELS